VGVAVGIAALMLAGGVAAASGRTVGARPTDQRLVVGYRAPAALSAALRGTGAVVVRRLPALHAAEVRTREPAARLRHALGIRFVTRPVARGAAAEPALAATATSPAGLEWEYHATREDGVPDSVLRAAASIRIAVIDTGADLTAPDLAPKSPTSYNTRTGTSDVHDTNGHGTLVASIAAGSVTNGDGIAGFGGDAQLLVVKAGPGDGTFTDVDEAAGILYAIDHGARILNLSFGGAGTTSIEKNAIRYAIDHGALVVAAAGNEFGQGNPVEYPAALLQPVGSNGTGGAGLSVGASTQTGVRASFSNTGSWISLAAPGDNVFGDLSSQSPAAMYPRTPLPGSHGGLYGYSSGTSFSAPQVTGAAALVWAADPQLTAQQVAQILKQTASGGGRWTPELGFGVIDVGAAVAMAQAGRPGVLLSGNRVKSRLHLTWSGNATSYTLTLTTGAGETKIVLAATPTTSTWVQLKAGRTYAFTVAALDPAGATEATSMPLTVALPIKQTRAETRR
jgi:subtilisin family serine protease